MSSEIEQAIDSEHWKEARRLIRKALRREPGSHWLLTRLSLTYYEQFDYKRALEISQRAYDLAPRCPLVLWDMAGSLEMLERHQEAKTLFRRLIRRGATSLSVGDCGEGLGWARGLVADSWYRLARCERDIGQLARALRCYERHLGMRGPGCRSIYAIGQVKKEMRDLRKRKMRL